ncbi:hypothetical protein NPIL_176301 [Nephila pilipes]|uniref:SCAN domain-containing protein 3 n=1 Tax=Nephila pilipes TaxID=299642 RepID=A0A8X6N4T1_NEPPI|nr:hypothetical protein NPIL_176301 [Nephila pilipes]
MEQNCLSLDNYISGQLKWFFWVGICTDGASGDGLTARITEVVPESEFTHCLNHREYPEIATTAHKSLLPFPTTYLCEAGFSAVTASKTKKQNKLNIRNTLQGVVVSYYPQIEPSCCKETFPGFSSFSALVSLDVKSLYIHF